YFPEGIQALLLDHGWTTAFTECGIGVALLVWPLRLVGVVAALVMHAFILFCLWKHQWNTIVWPWNIAMMAFVLILFVNTRRVAPWHIVWPKRFLFAPVTLVLFGIMPLFNFFELWDSYLSAALYSGNTPQARLSISPEMFERLPREAKQFAGGFFAGEDADGNAHIGYGVDLFGLAIAELDVPSYPSPRVYPQIARYFATLAPGEVILVIRGRPDWKTGDRKETVERIKGRE